MNRAAALLEPWKRRLINKQTGLFVSICVIIGVIGIVFNSNPPVGVMLIFSAIFLGAFVLIALNHDKQVTIIMIACAIALLLAMVLSIMNLFEGFSFEKVLLPTEHHGYQEWEVLAVVFGMTLLVEAVSETGFFDWVIITLLKFSKGAVYPLFIITFLITLALSTVLANVTAMILMGSMILTICKGLDYNPTPFLMAAVLATDLAGMATPVSSLPALLISGPSYGNIPFVNFLLISGPFILICIPICIYYLKKVYPPEKIPLRPGSSIDTDLIMSLDPWGVIEDRRRFYLAAVALGLTIIGFVFAQPLRESFNLPISIGVIAILGGVLAIILTRADEHNLLSNMGWDTLLVFAGLFILIGTLGDTKILDVIAQQMKLIVGENLFLAGALILIITGVFSGILDNIPVAAALIPVVKEINEPFKDTNPKFLWYILVFSGAVGGGWTPFGSAAGILAVSLLSKEGRPLSFASFIKTFVPICAILLVLSGIYLTILAIFIGL